MIKQIMNFFRWQTSQDFNCDDFIVIVAVGLDYVNHKRSHERLEPFIAKRGKMEMRLIWIKILGWLENGDFCDENVCCNASANGLRLNYDWDWCKHLTEFVEFSTEMCYLFEVRESHLCFKYDVSIERRLIIQKYVKKNYIAQIMY